MTKVSLKIAVGAMALALFASPSFAQGAKPAPKRPDRKKRSDKRPSRADILKKFDKDGDGKLSESEKKAARAAMAKHKKAQDHVAAIFKRLDKNKDGKICHREASKAPARVKKLLRGADKNGDKCIDRKELAAALRKANAKRPKNGKRPDRRDPKNGKRPAKPRAPRTP
jgi:Ca2+-binding EF-hand superfamily protein